MSWGARFELSRRQEQLVIGELEKRGWIAFPFGQGQVPQDARDILRDFKDSARRPSLIRWMPDILALRGGERAELVLIDAKATSENNKSTGNHAFEMSAVESAEVFINHLFTPVVFVCSGGLVLTPRTIRDRGKPGPPTLNGSGTPYLFVRSGYAESFTDVFGPRLAPAHVGASVIPLRADAR